MIKVVIFASAFAKKCESSSLKDFHKQTSSTRAKFIRTSGKRKEPSILIYIGNWETLDIFGCPDRLNWSFRPKWYYYNEEFDPGSGWTLATGLTHASRGAAEELAC